MGTALDIISNALSEIHVLQAGGTPSSAEQAWGLKKLNELIDSWNAKSDRLFYVLTESAAVTDPAASLTIGPTAEAGGPDLAYTERPVEIVSAGWVNAAGFKYPIGIISPEQYAMIDNKLIEGAVPIKLSYSQTLPYGTVKLYPVPTETDYLLELTYRAKLAEFPTTGSTYIWPPGYRKAVTLNLAVALCPSFQIQPDPVLVQEAQFALNDIIENNVRALRLMNVMPQAAIPAPVNQAQ